MDTTVRDAGSPQVTSRRRRPERHAAARSPRVDRILVVSSAGEPTAEPTGGESLGSTLVVGGLTGFVLMAAAVYVVGLAVGAGPAGSLGMAVFCAVWGGVGFGCMFGGVVYTVREEHREAAAVDEVVPAPLARPVSPAAAGSPRRGPW